MSVEPSESVSDAREYLTIEEIDEEIKRRTKALDAANEERARVHALLADPVQQARRRQSMRMAMADWVERLPLSDQYWENVKRYLPSNESWIVQHPALEAGGWVVEEREGQRVWTLAPDRAPDLALAAGEAGAADAEAEAR